jgi:hypothetical protein
VELSSERTVACCSRPVEEGAQLVHSYFAWVLWGQLEELSKLGSPEDLFVEMGEELQSLEADRMFLEGEILRHQEKFEKFEERLRRSETAKAHAECQVEKLKKELEAERRRR